MFPHPNTCFPLKSVRSLNSLLLVSGFIHFHVCNYADTVSTYMHVVNKYADTKSVPSINNTDTCQHSQRLCGHTFSECIHSCWRFVFQILYCTLKKTKTFAKLLLPFHMGPIYCWVFKIYFWPNKNKTKQKGRKFHDTVPLSCLMRNRKNWDFWPDMVGHGADRYPHWVTPHSFHLQTCGWSL